MIRFKLILYIILTFVAAYGISGINFNGWIKKDRVWEAKILAISLAIALGYLLTQFVWEFLNVTKL